MISLRSKISQKLLSYLFLNEDSTLYLNQIKRKFDFDKRNLNKKLKELCSKGILESEVIGNQKYYSLNKNHPLYYEYKKLVLKSFGLEEILKRSFKKCEEIEKAYIFGSYANNNMDDTSDIDLLIVGDISLKLINKIIIDIQENYDREINPVIMSKEEFINREKNNDSFIKSVLRNNIRIK